jgi:hypothetical protein
VLSFTTLFFVWIAALFFRRAKVRRELESLEAVAQESNLF